MSNSVRFFSCLQTGLSTAIDAIADENGVPASALATVVPKLRISGIDRDFSQPMTLRGPGDVMRIDAGAIAAVEPKPQERDVEPNFFPYVELTDATLPWMFTPALPNNGRLMPWMVLVVVPKTEAVSLVKLASAPGMALSISGGAGDILPPLTEAYAWAHVEDRSGAADPSAAFAARPADFIARLMCPVHMARNSAYIAALVPAFEAGRLHRTFDDEALRTRLLDGALDSIMFPEDPVANAPRILEDIRAVFPPCQGQFVFGAMLKLGWGTPSVLTLDLGVIVELPDPVKIALLGQLNLSLPKPDKTIIELNMDVFGVVNITEGTIAVDATIRDSHILELLTLSGDMAFRASFGDQPSMLMSVGGFHPKFTPPPGIPDLRRMRASLPVGKVGSVDLLAYIAITSNSFQAGGRIDIWVKAAGFTAEGYFGFDALIQFSPFGFDFYVEFGVTVSAGKVTLMGVDVSASVVGPGPWIIDGQATFKILKIKKKLQVDFEVGKRKNVPVPAYDVEAELIKELENSENWIVPEDTGGAAFVVLREPDGSEAARVLPSGTVAFRQKTVPLNLKLEKFGAGTIVGRKEFQIESTSIAAGVNSYDGSGDLTEWFAPAEYLKMKDNEKLKAPAYELFDCGVEIGGGGVSFGTEATRARDFEEITIDPALNIRVKPKIKRPMVETKDLIARMQPAPREMKYDGPELKLKEALTQFADARLIGKRKVA